MRSLLARGQAWEERIDISPYAGLFLRVVLAVYWTVHLLYKVLDQGMVATEASFEQLGFAGWLAWPDVALESLGVLFLLLGLYVRSVSLLLLVILVPALKLWIPNGVWAIHGGYEFPLMWILAQVCLVLAGPGPFALVSIPTIISGSRDG